jgi:ADP-heptose:LPS heptosyltransferase
MIKVLIISANAMGDTYLSCSAIEPLKRCFKEVSFDIITIKDSEMFMPFTDVNNVYYLDRRGASELFKARSFLSSREYDYVFSFFPGRMNTFLVKQSGSVNKYFYKNLLKVEDWYKTSQNVHHNTENLDIVWEPDMNYLDRIKIIIDTVTGTDNVIRKPLLNVPPMGSDPEFRDVTINFSSREKNRSLYTELVEELSEYLYRVYSLKVTVLDFYGDLVNSKVELNFPENYKFPAIYNEIVNSKLFITVDSFLLHPADASGVNMLSVFGPTNPVSVLSKENKNYIRINPIKDIKIEHIIPAVRTLLKVE